MNRRYNNHGRNYNRPNRNVNRSNNYFKIRTADGKKVNVNVPKNIPEHILEVAYIIHFNHAIRRHTALNILNYFIQKGMIVDTDKDKYVDFSEWNKFGVYFDGLKREYTYNEQFFIDAVVGAFKAFAEDAQRVLQNFINVENGNVPANDKVESETVKDDKEEDNKEP